MALPPTSNAGTQYFNRNQCRSFEQGVTTSLIKLSGGAAGGFPCSEAIIYNAGGTLMYIYDRAEFTFRGLTNVDQVSAKTSTGTSIIRYRTQFFSSNTSTS